VEAASILALPPVATRAPAIVAAPAIVLAPTAAPAAFGSPTPMAAPAIVLAPAAAPATLGPPTAMAAPAIVPIVPVHFNGCTGIGLNERPRARGCVRLGGQGGKQAERENCGNTLFHIFHLAV